MIEVDESQNPLTTGTYEPDRVPQGFKAPDEFGRMRPNPLAGGKIGGGYDAPQGTPTWEPTWDQTSGITNPNLNGYRVWNAGGVQDKIDSWLGPLIEKNVDLENWEPTPWDFGIGNWIKNKINPRARLEKAKEENKLLNQELDEARMHPYFPAPGPWNEFYPGDVEHINDLLFEDEGIEPYEWDESVGTELAQSKWKQQDNMEITIDDLIQRPEFEGWTRDEIKGWLYGQARANRGGIIGLL